MTVVEGNPQRILDRGEAVIMPPSWIIQPGPQTDRAIAMIKAFIARQLRAQQPVG
jgi:hypothetical protein